MSKLVGASVVPRVEGPIPDTIGLSTIFAIAGAGGVLALVAASTRGLPETQREDWARRGVSVGFWVGLVLYALALVNELL